MREKEMRKTKENVNFELSSVWMNSVAFLMNNCWVLRDESDLWKKFMLRASHVRIIEIILTDLVLWIMLRQFVLRHWDGIIGGHWCSVGLGGSNHSVTTTTAEMIKKKKEEKQNWEVGNFCALNLENVCFSLFAHLVFLILSRNALYLIFISQHCLLNNFSMCVCDIEDIREHIKFKMRYVILDLL